MSSSTEYSGISGQKPAKSPEKSTFSQTCSLLSQYIKKNGSFGDLTLGIAGTNAETQGSPETSCLSATTTTMDLFPTKENNVRQQNLTTMDLLFSHARHSAEEVPTTVNSSGFKCVGKEAKGTQLTIFYGGQVMVFDDVPTGKMEEILSFAKKGVSQGGSSSSSSNSNNSVHAYTQSQKQFLLQNNPQAPSTPIDCDLPIARKASLHRFLEKRKDRIASKAPYQTNNLNKSAESMAWLGLGANSTL